MGSLLYGNPAILAPMFVNPHLGHPDIDKKHEEFLVAWGGAQGQQRSALVVRRQALRSPRGHVWGFRCTLARNPKP